MVKDIESVDVCVAILRTDIWLEKTFKSRGDSISSEDDDLLGVQLEDSR